MDLEAQSWPESPAIIAALVDFPPNNCVGNRNKLAIVFMIETSFFGIAGGVHCSGKNSERVSAQFVCCAGICLWKQFKGKDTVIPY